MDKTERQLLNIVQGEFPIDSHPYLVLGKSLNISEEEAFRHILKLYDQGIIRRMGGVFDSRRLGYYSTLCAAKVPPDRIDGLAVILNKITGVTHNYLRDHTYNMWFTLIAPSRAAVETTLKKLRELSGVNEIYSLPALRLFKIRVDFDFESGEGEWDWPGKDEQADPQVIPAPATDEKSGLDLSEETRALVRALQLDLPHDMRPFDRLAEELGWTEEQVLSGTRDLMACKAIRRFGAVLRHQRAGFVANAMGVWKVDDVNAAKTGETMAKFKEVSHCYQRPILPDWPYNLYTMIHGRTPEDCRNAMRKISEITGIKDFDMLFSKAELKKSSMLYFIE